MDEPAHEIPLDMQPDPADVAFDLGRTLSSVVSLRAEIPDDAFTAGSLGTERRGHGVVIADGGLVLTIGYLIVEAASVWLIDAGGRAVANNHDWRLKQADSSHMTSCFAKLWRKSMKWSNTATTR